MTVELLTKHHLDFLSLIIVGCTGSMESTLVIMPHCWKSHVMAQLFFHCHYLSLFCFDYHYIISDFFPFSLFCISSGFCIFNFFQISRMNYFYQSIMEEA